MKDLVTERIIKHRPILFFWQVFDLRQCHLQMQSLANCAQKAAQMQAAVVAGVSAVGAPRSKSDLRAGAINN